MIILFDNPLQIPKLVKMAEAVPGAPLAKLKDMMFSTLNQPGTKAYIDYNSGDIRGFIYASIEEFDGDRCVFIQFCVVRPGELERSIGFELLTKMKLWAKEENIDKLYFITQRDPKAYIRKYHFEYHGSVLKMNINKGERS